MLTKKEIEEIKDIISKSNNPSYLFDDDGDGLCSYLMLKKHYERGMGTPIKRAGPLDEYYTQHTAEEKADLIIVLDKAVMSQKFIDSAHCRILYIDHHPLQKIKNAKLKYFNPLKHNKKSYVPTSEMIYSIVETNMWIAVVGCLFDYKVPPFIKQFKKEYPGIINKITKDAGHYKFKTEMGKLIKIFNFNLKGKPAETKKSIEALEKVESPYEILNQTTEYGKYLYKRYEILNNQYERILEKAKLMANKEKVLVFTYPTEQHSFTSDISTELSYMYPNKTIIIGREKGDEMRLSLRNQKKNIARILSKALGGLQGNGGGHPHACGGMVPRENFEIFVNRIKKLTK